jgi:hypothetical protein
VPTPLARCWREGGYQCGKLARTLDPNAVAVDLETITQLMALPLFPAHTTGVLLSAFGAIALLLAMTGL